MQMSPQINKTDLKEICQHNLTTVYIVLKHIDSNIMFKISSS